MESPADIEAPTGKQKLPDHPEAEIGGSKLVDIGIDQGDTGSETGGSVVFKSYITLWLFRSLK